MSGITVEEKRLIEIDQQFPEFRQELNALLTLYTHANFSLLAARKVYRDAERAFNEKWQCNFAIVVSHYHRIMGETP